MTRRVVLDVSNYQNEAIDFARIKREHPEVVGVIVKATEGVTFVDPMFATHVHAAQAAGLATGCYTFVRPSNVRTDDMQKFLDVAAPFQMRLGYWLDVETDDGVDPATLLARVVEKVKYVDTRKPNRTGFYTDSWFWNPKTQGSVAAHVDQWPLWFAAYSITMPPPPVPWTSPLLWQFTDAYPTHIGPVDASVWQGTDAQWADWTGIPSGGGMDTRAVQQALVSIGWPLTIDGNAGPQTTQAVRDFQQAWNPVPVGGNGWLTVDGNAGPLTQKALALSVYTGGLLSQHFRGREFACNHCGWVKTHRVLLAALEKIRPAGGLAVVSGYRCPVHNRDIGGASNSQHIYGTAADIAPIYTLSQIKTLRLFSGIEYRKDGRVYHVDVRADGPNNTTHSSNVNPSVFLWG